MRVVFPNGEDAMSSLTPEQMIALDNVRERWHLNEPVEISPEFGGRAVMVNVGTMWLGVEPDGYTHS